MELFTFNFLLWVFRPRKEWPDYFSLGLGGLAAEANRQGRPDMDLTQMVNNMVPIFTSTIDSRKLFGMSRPKNLQSSSFGSAGSFSSFGSMEEDSALVIMNPNEYTIQDSEVDRNGSLFGENPYIEDERQERGVIHIQN